MSVPRETQLNILTMLLAKLLGDKDQIQDVDNTIAIGIWGGFTETVGNLNQIHDIDMPITVDIGKAAALEIDFAVKVREQVGDGCSVVSPIRDRSSR